MKATIKTLSRTVLMVLCIAVFAHALTACGNPTITDNNSNGNANSVNNVDLSHRFGSVTITVTEPATVKITPVSSGSEFTQYIEKSFTFEKVFDGEYYIIVTLENRMTVSQYSGGKHLPPVVVKPGENTQVMVKPRWIPPINNVYCQYWSELDGKYSTGKSWITLNFSEHTYTFDYEDRTVCGAGDCYLEEYTVHFHKDPNVKGFLDTESNGKYSIQYVNIQTNEILHYGKCQTDESIPAGLARKN